MDIEEMSKLYRQGLSLTQIAAKAGVAHTTIRKYLKRANIPMKPRGHQKGVKLLLETRQKLAVSKIGEKNPRWKGDTVTDQAGRARAERNLPHIKGAEKHHKDGNPLNNTPENIEYVTRKQHMTIDGRLARRDASGRFKKI
jgi:hypothetical protein